MNAVYELKRRICNIEDVTFSYAEDGIEKVAEVFIFECPKGFFVSLDEKTKYFEDTENVFASGVFATADDASEFVLSQIKINDWEVVECLN